MSLESPLGSHHGDYGLAKKQSSSPEPNDGKDAGGRHRRNYQACDKCRGRKVKCDLGPVDAPHPPPCARCRRERVPCIFADQRKKGPQSEEQDEIADAGVKRRRTNSGDYVQAPGYESIGAVLDAPSGRHPNIDPALPGMRPPPPTSMPTHRSPPMPDPRLMQPIGQGFREVNHQGAVKEEVRSSGAESTFTFNPPATTKDSLMTMLQAAQQLDGIGRDPQKLKEFQRSAAGGPVTLSEQTLTPEQRQEREKVLNVWRAARFVRAGWFTAEEALQYVEYFYTNLQPMTPVDVTEFRSPRRHLALLTEEPVLAVAILTISSRYMKPSGRASDTRGHKIHERLWASLMEQVQRIFWGQEQFGGGFTGAGVSRVRESASGQITWPGSLRTLGAIEALLLLSDWQPRSLHFPPDDDDNHLLNINYDKLPSQAGANGNTGHNPSLDGLPYASWLEPAWRSDKMCWMLMCLAQGISFELGLFDANDVEGPSSISPIQQQRQTRIRRMVLVYVAQISGRNGIPSPLRLSDWESSYDYGSTSPIEHTQGLFVHIASIMNRANREIFPTRQFTRELTRGTEYRKSIATFAPLLESWMRHFEQVESSLQDPMRSILLMEYEYARLYINSLGMQNVVESWMRTDPQTQNSMSSVAKVVSENKKYIHEVTNASVHILEIVSDALGHRHLRDAPVRVFLRCLSAMMFTLKRLSLGNHEKMVRKCLALLDRVCVLLAQEVVDDVHLCAQTSILIQSIVRHVRKTLIRVQKPNNTSGAPSREQSRAQTPHHGHPAENGQVDQQQQHPVSLAPALAMYSHDPLADIPARPMADLMNQTFIAPPNFNFQTNEFDDFIDDASLDRSMLSENPADWITMPLDGLMNSGDTSIVDQGFHSTGPVVGSRDMLEVLTNHDYNEMQGFGHVPWAASPTMSYHGFSHHT